MGMKMRVTEKRTLQFFFLSIFHVYQTCVCSHIATKDVVGPPFLNAKRVLFLLAFFHPCFSLGWTHTREKWFAAIFLGNILNVCFFSLGQKANTPFQNVKKVVSLLRERKVWRLLKALNKYISLIFIAFLHCFFNILILLFFCFELY